MPQGRSKLANDKHACASCASQYTPTHLALSKAWVAEAGQGRERHRRRHCDRSRRHSVTSLIFHLALRSTAAVGCSCRLRRLRRRCELGVCPGYDRLLYLHVLPRMPVPLPLLPLLPLLEVVLQLVL